MVSSLEQTSHGSGNATPEFTELMKLIVNKGAKIQRIDLARYHNRVCTVCHAIGHELSNCKLCPICENTRHTGKNVPKAGEHWCTLFWKCERCQGLGHRTADCKNPSLNSPCLRCGNQGHIADDCPFLFHAYEYKETNAVQATAACYNCGRSGHYGDECPNYRNRIRSLSMFSKYSLENAGRRIVNRVQTVVHQENKLTVVGQSERKRQRAKVRNRKKKDRNKNKLDIPDEDDNSIEKGKNYLMYERNSGKLRYRRKKQTSKRRRQRAPSRKGSKPANSSSS
ncbi:hypothetical protein VTP01DRAFT_9038 [Rhizomucor pusillus]|uniref:uncharacterized protein n=1 Tax=Rhizomucor pusillus TaxID=4840 RepID=UPI003742B636